MVLEVQCLLSLQVHLSRPRPEKSHLINFRGHPDAFQLSKSTPIYSPLCGHADAHQMSRSVLTASPDAPGSPGSPLSPSKPYEKVQPDCFEVPENNR